VGEWLAVHGAIPPLLAVIVAVTAWLDRRLPGLFITPAVKLEWPVVMGTVCAGILVVAAQLVLS
jgi:hypothetical protein